MNYTTLNKKTLRKSSEKESAEIYSNETIIIDANHPLAIAAEKAREDHRNGKTLSPEQILDMIKRGEFDD